jgi:hypothetical protein
VAAFRLRAAAAGGSALRLTEGIVIRGAVCEPGRAQVRVRACVRMCFSPSLPPSLSLSLYI